MNLKIELKHRVLWSEDVLAFLTTAVGVLKTSLDKALKDSASERALSGNAAGFLKLKAHPQLHTSSNKTIPHPTRPLLLIMPKQFHQLEVKHSNV